MSDPIARCITRTAAAKLTRDPERRPVAATYATLKSCPSSCAHGPLESDSSCYTTQGRVAAQQSRLERAADASRAAELTPAKIAQAEALEIRRHWIPDGRPLRVHISGDCRTPAAARIVAEAVAEQQQRGGGAAWTFTHAWHVTTRSDWAPISVLASVETPAAAARAHRRGYAAAAVVTEFQSNKPHAFGDFNGIPCPQQTGSAPDCATCGLCFRSDQLHRQRRVILFKSHGPTRRLKHRWSNIAGTR